MVTSDCTHSYKNALTSHERAELFFGLVSPSGTPNDKVIEALEAALLEVGYRSEPVSLSSLIDHVTGDKSKGLSEDERIEYLMAAGTHLRETASRGDMAALLAISGVRQIRQEQNIKAGQGGEKPTDSPLQGVAYILRSLKTPAEVETLRNVYGQAFNAISVYSSENDRLDNLSRRIAQSHHRSDASDYRDTAQRLIRIDREEQRELGQNVRDTFPLADFFLKYGQSADMRAELSRFVRLLFGDPFITPTRDEYAMFLAKAVAMRSADLGRQVGVAVTTTEGDVISVGCNEVPKFGGGLYWERDDPDFRDFRTGEDAGTLHRKQALLEFFDRLGKAKWLSRSAIEAGPEALVDEVLGGQKKEMFKRTQALSVIEYGRAVHAEMAAITDAARRGVGVTNGTLFSTTFPCHLCARHIVASGIKRVVYIEPYPKSKAEDLYHDSIAVNPDGRPSGKVAFEPFVGVSPTKYLQLFEVSVDRKESSGKVINWEDGKQRKSPRFKRFVLSYIMIEQRIGDQIVDSFLKDYDSSEIQPRRAHGQEMEFERAGGTGEEERQ